MKFSTVDERDVMRSFEAGVELGAAEIAAQPNAAERDAAAARYGDAVKRANEARRRAAEQLGNAGAE